MHVRANPLLKSSSSIIGNRAGSGRRRNCLVSPGERDDHIAAGRNV